MNDKVGLLQYKIRKKFKHFGIIGAHLINQGLKPNKFLLLPRHLTTKNHILKALS